AELPDLDGLATHAVAQLLENDRARIAQLDSDGDKCKQWRDQRQDDRREDLILDRLDEARIPVQWAGAQIDDGQPGNTLNRVIQKLQAEQVWKELDVGSR